MYVCVYILLLLLLIVDFWTHLWLLCTYFCSCCCYLTFRQHIHANDYNTYLFSAAGWSFPACSLHTLCIYYIIFIYIFPALSYIYFINFIFEFQESRSDMKAHHHPGWCSFIWPGYKHFISFHFIVCPITGVSLDSDNVESYSLLYPPSSYY